MTRSKPKNSPPTHVLVGGFSLLILVTILISFVEWQSQQSTPKINTVPDKQSLSFEEMNTLTETQNQLQKTSPPILLENEKQNFIGTDNQIPQSNAAGSGAGPGTSTPTTTPTKTSATKTSVTPKTGNIVNVPTTVDVRDTRTQMAPEEGL